MDITRWIDDLIDSWPVVLLGVVAGVGLQLILALLLMVSGLPLVTPFTFVLAELSILAGGFAASWLTKRAHLVRSVSVGVICAFISLIASTWENAARVSPLSVLVLLITYAVMGGLGGYAAIWIKARGERRTTQHW